MPSMATTVLVGLLIAAFSVFLGFVWGEKAEDEREHFISLIAGRIAFLIGAGILVIGVVIQALLKNTPDPWLMSALAGMVVAKIAGLVYGKIKK